MLAHILSLLSLSPVLELSNSKLSLSMSTLWTKACTKESGDSRICLPSHAFLRSHSRQSSFNLSKVNILTVLDSLFVSNFISIFAFNSPVVMYGPVPSTHVHRSGELFEHVHGVGEAISSAPSPFLVYILSVMQSFLKDQGRFIVLVYVVRGRGRAIQGSGRHKVVSKVNGKYGAL